MFPKYVQLWILREGQGGGGKLLAPAGLDLLDVSCAAAMWGRRICGQ